LAVIIERDGLVQLLQQAVLP